MPHEFTGAGRLIADMSQEVGFAEQSHFTTVFRTLVGTTPRTYQRQRGGEYKNGKIPQIPHKFGHPWRTDVLGARCDQEQVPEVAGTVGAGKTWR